MSFSDPSIEEVARVFPSLDDTSLGSINRCFNIEKRFHPYFGREDVRCYYHNIEGRWVLWIGDEQCYLMYKRGGGYKYYLKDIEKIMDRIVDVGHLGFKEMDLLLEEIFYVGTVESNDLEELHAARKKICSLQGRDEPEFNLGLLMEVSSLSGVEV
jgi:hypothetical protein